MLDKEESAFTVHRKDKIPLSFSNLFNGLLTRYARDIHEDVDHVVEPCRGEFRHRLDLRLIRHVGGQAGCVVSCGSQLRHSRVHLILFEIGDEHPRTALGQSLRDALADRAGRAGHQRRLPFEV